MNLRSKLHDLKRSVTSFLYEEVQYQKELKAMSPEKRKQRELEISKFLEERRKEFDEARKEKRAENAQKFKTNVKKAIQRVKPPKLHDLKLSVTNYFWMKAEYQKELKAMSPEERKQHELELSKFLEERRKEFDEVRKEKRAENAQKFKTNVKKAIQRVKPR